MHRRDWQLLFSEYDLSAVLDGQLRSVNDRVIKIDQRRFDAESDELLAASIASELVVEPVELLDDEIAVSRRRVGSSTWPFLSPGRSAPLRCALLGDIAGGRSSSAELRCDQNRASRPTTLGLRGVLSRDSLDGVLHRRALLLRGLTAETAGVRGKYATFVLTDSRFFLISEFDSRHSVV